MKNLYLFLIVLFAGWLLGWYSHVVFQPAGTARFDENPISFAPTPARPFTPKIITSPQTPAAIAPDSTRTTGNSNTAEPNALQVALERHDYERAINMISAITDDSLQQIRAKKLYWLHLDTLYKEHNHNQAERALRAWLEVEYADPEALSLLAKIYFLQKQTLQAIVTLYEGKSYAHAPDKIAQFEDAIRILVTAREKELAAEQNESKRLDFYQQLTLLDPGYSPYFIALAESQVKLGLYAQAQQSLSLVSHDITVQAQARRIQQSIEQTTALTQPATLDIPLIKFGNHYLVDAVLNERQPVRLLIDTGASMTVVKPHVLNAIHAQIIRQQWFSTAGGKVHANVFNAGYLGIGEIGVNNLEIASVPLSDMTHADGLLGMNFLKHYPFFIDQQNNVLRIMVQ